MLLTHPKIATLHPDWAPFAGWSLIFRGADGGGTTPDGFAPDAATAAVLAETAQVLKIAGPEQLMRDLLLCLLPAESYHVTFADLLHQGQLSRLSGIHRDKVAQVLASLEGPPPAFLQQLGADPVPDWPGVFRLRIGGLTTLGGSVVALDLKPDVEPGSPWSEALEWRTRLQHCLAVQTGLTMPEFRPHLTLGYFANPDLAAGLAPALKPLSDLVADRLTGRVLTWQAIGLYHFSSMAAFRLASG